MLRFRAFDEPGVAGHFSVPPFVPPMKTIATVLAFSLAAMSSRAAIVTKDVEYEQGGVKLQGFLAYDDAKTERRASCPACSWSTSGGA